MLKQSQQFFDVLKENSITILITKYPINVNYDEISSLLSSAGIEFYFLEKPAVWKKIPLLEKKVKNPCHVGNRVKIFNKRFNKDYPTDHNGINIHECKCLDELLTFLSNPIPLCSYCGVCEMELIDWGDRKEILKNGF